MRKTTYFRLVRKIAAYLRSLGVRWIRTYSDKRSGGTYRTKFAMLDFYGNLPRATAVMSLLQARFGRRKVRMRLVRSHGQQFGNAYVSLSIVPLTRLRAV